MSNVGHRSSRILLGTVILLVVPLLAFPGQFGSGVGKASAINILIELAYYGTLVYVFNRRAEGIRIAALAGGCLTYRVLAGTLFGVIVSVAYSLGLITSIRLGVYGYWPVLLVQAAATPFVLKPLLEQHAVSRPVLRAARRDAAGNDQSPVMNSIAISKEKGIVSESHSMSLPAETESRHGSVAIESVTMPAPQFEVNAFERATKYLGEHGSVYLAVVVDPEGLLLASFKRGNLIPEDWAPLALVIWQVNRRSLERSRLGNPEKIDVVFHEKRLVIAHEAQFSLMVLAERQSDDTLAIRINQCMELVRKYIAERYGTQSKDEVNAERIHVSHSK